LGFFEKGRPNKNKNKMSSDMRSVADPKLAAKLKTDQITVQLDKISGVARGGGGAAIRRGGKWE